mgnify:CR=1 FL=1
MAKPVRLVAKSKLDALQKKYIEVTDLLESAISNGSLSRCHKCGNYSPSHCCCFDCGHDNSTSLPDID